MKKKNTQALFEDKVVLITGGTDGLGYGAAEMFIKEGAHVIVFARNSLKLNRAKNLLGNKLYTIQGDVSNMRDIDALYEEIGKNFKKINIILANAGTNILAKTIDVTEKNYDIIFNTNTKGAFFTVQKALSLLQEGSSVIFVSSTAAHSSETGDCVYAGSKAALRAFAMTFSAEYAKKQIRFNVISPTMTRTPLLESLGNEDFLNHWAERHPPGRLAKISDFVNAVKFLASGDSEFIYGQDIVVDGGKCNNNFRFIETTGLD